MPGRARGRWTTANLAAAVALLGAGAAGAFTVHPRHHPPLSATALVARSIERATAHATAAVRATLSIGPGVASAEGTGSIDIRDGALSVNLAMRLPGLGPTVPIAARFIGPTLYEQIPGVSSVERGRSWIAIDLSKLGAVAGASTGVLAADGNPAVALRLLGMPGGVVTPLGPAVVGGSRLQGYRVAGGAWERGTAYIYLDRSGRLRRFRSVVDVVLRGRPTAVEQIFDFGRIQGAVTIPRPPPAQTVDFQQFLHDQAARR